MRPDGRLAEQRDRTIHGDHRDVSEFFDREVLGRTARGDNKHSAALGVATLFEITHMTQPGVYCWMCLNYFHVRCPLGMPLTVLMFFYTPGNGISRG
ncbi:hypothetical protein D3C76_1580310 [compost metagenome]